MNDPRTHPPEGDPAAKTDPSPLPPSAGAKPGSENLTPEEQMALYEENLKETDWGHQPC